MTEPKAEYNVDTRPVDIRCPNCGHPLRATIHRVNGTEFLIIGNLVVDEIHGSCIDCKERYHFEISKKALAKFILYLP